MKIQKDIEKNNFPLEKDMFKQISDIIKEFNSKINV